MTVAMEEPGRFVCICPPKELHDGARRGRAEEIRAQIDKMGFGVDAQLFIGDGGGIAVSKGPELYNDGTVVVAFCGELTNKEYLLHKLGHDDEAVEAEMKESNLSARLVGKLFEQSGEHPQGLVGKLRGTYTFVVFDIERVRMFAARDCSGPISLYQSRLSDGTMVLSNYVSQDFDQNTEVPPGHYLYGVRRCSFPQKFSQSKDELQKAQVDAKSAVSKALQGILTRSELQPRLHQSIQTRARRSAERQRSPERRQPHPPAPAVVTVLSQTIHTAEAPRRKHGNKHNSSSWRSESSQWWRKPQPKPLSAAAAPFVMHSEETTQQQPAEKEKESETTVEARPVVAAAAEEAAAAPAEMAEKELIIEAVNQLHRIASSGKIQCLIKVQEQELSSSGGMRRTPSCGEMEKLIIGSGGMQRVDSLKHITDQSMLSNEAH